MQENKYLLRKNFIHSSNQYVTPPLVLVIKEYVMLPQIHLISEIHTQISGHQSTTNIQPITVDQLVLFI